MKIDDNAPELPVSQLRLDTDNPRVVETGHRDPSQNALVATLWREMAAEEVALSIAHSGYFRHERLFVEKRGKHYVVIEGNRRLAAVLVLTDASHRARVGAKSLPKLTAAAAAKLETLPCIVTTRKELWRYIGFKHVNGPLSWGAYAKAQYVAHVHNNYGVSLAEITLQIGDQNNTVERQYHGLMVVEQAERANVFNRDDVYNKFFFNYIYTALTQTGFRDFLGLTKASRTELDPVPKSKLKNLGELCKWLWGSKAGDTQSLIRSQNPDLRHLGEILASPEGIASLRRGAPLDVAHDVGKGDERLFTQALSDAKAALQKAHATVTTGFRPPDAGATRLADELVELADDLVDKMQRKAKKGRRR